MAENPADEWAFSFNQRSWYGEFATQGEAIGAGLAATRFGFWVGRTYRDERGVYRVKDKWHISRPYGTTDATAAQ